MSEFKLESQRIDMISGRTLNMYISRINDISEQRRRRSRI